MLSFFRKRVHVSDTLLKFLLLEWKFRSRNLSYKKKKRIPKVDEVVDCNEVILFSLRHAFDIMKINSFQNEPRSRLHISLQSDHS